MRPAPGTRDDYRHFHRHSTRWGDNDSYGHLNNVVHMMLIDSTVNAWLIEKGLLQPLHGTLIGLVVENGCRYHTELSYPQEVIAGLRVAHIGRSAVRYEVALFGVADDRAAAEGFRRMSMLMWCHAVRVHFLTGLGWLSQRLSRRDF